MKRIASSIFALLLAGSAFGQESGDYEKRLLALEAKLQEVQRNSQQAIDALSREIESLKNQQKPAALATASTSTYGLGAAASKVYRSESGVSFGGYGEFVYDKPRGESAIANLERAVLYTGYKFSPRALFNSELEVEDATTESGGNVSIEFAYLDFLLRPEANIRAGQVLLPVGLINEQHEPTAYFGVQRPLTESVVIPSTWSDLGVGLFGDRGRFSYRGYVLTGLNPAGFNAEEGLRGGRQKGSHALADDLAFVGRADFHPFEGTMIGGSVYRSKVTLVEAHADARLRGLSLRGLIARGTFDDSPGTANSLGKRFGGWYTEAGYDLGAVLPMGERSLTPYVRYEQAHTQSANRENLTTLGVAFRPITQAVIKMDYVRARQRRFNLGLGYIF
jgi:hypothetical protein